MARNKSVSTGSNCKQLDSGQHVQGTAIHDRVQ
jgi:hypothetical protein